MELIVVSGISGSGKSTAIHALEDNGYYCVDNLPSDLLGELGTVLSEGPNPVPRAAVGIDVRTRAQLEEVPQVLEHLTTSGRVSVRGLFLEASEQSLIRRFSETRRRHPLTEGDRSLPEAIAAEREQLAPLAEVADWVLDTSNLSVHTLRRRIQELTAAGQDTQGPILLFQSFGYKHGVPMDSDLLFDIRFLPNPNYEPELVDRSGLDEQVRAFLDNQPDLEPRLQDIVGLLSSWLPAYRGESRSYLTVSIGCTGGRHRSVHVAERLGEHFHGEEGEVLVRHRDLEGSGPSPRGQRE